MRVQTNEQDKIFLDKLEDMIRQVEKSYICRFSYFLDPRQQTIANRRLQSSGLNYCFWGGFADAQRKLLGIFPQTFEDATNVSYPDYEQGVNDRSHLSTANSYISNFPLVPLTFTFRIQDVLGHRDFLGSFMGLKIKRELVGDILVEPGKAVAFLTKVASQLVFAEVTKIGSVGVHIQEGLPQTLPKGFELVPIKGTVGSMRMDCVVAMVTGLSREKAAACIRSGEVGVNFFENTQVSGLLKEGDILSIRGWGRYAILQIGEQTKKGRIHLICNKYC